MSNTKKRQHEEANSSNNNEVTTSEIKELERGIFESKSNYNNFETLLEYTENESPNVIHASIHALHRSFLPLLSKGELQKPKRTTKNSKAVVMIWLRENYVRYVNKLCSLLGHEEPALQIPALNILLDLLKIESTYLTASSKSHHFSNNHYYRVVEGLIDNENFNEQLKEEFCEKYWNIYDDLRFYFLKDASKIINLAMDSGKPKDKSGPVSKKKRTDEKKPDDARLNNLMENTLSILEGLRKIPTSPSEINNFWTDHPAPELSKKQDANANDTKDLDDMDDASDIELYDIFFEDGDFNMEEKDKKEKKGIKGNKDSSHNNNNIAENKLPILLQLSYHRRVFSDCWLALLKLPMTQELYKKVLLIMHKKIIPYMSQPIMLMDFLTESYNAGGAISILALNGLFTLINEHNLDYPDFYKKLYNLFDRNLMHVKYRARFFRLVDLFLSSTHLPVQLVASFIKRMSRLSLTSPPHGIVIIMPMIYNLIRRHPSCMVLIHRPSDSTSSTSDESDPYDFDEPDPMKSNAIDSSLWEMKTLQNHYFPNIATLAKIFQEKFTKISYNLEDFLDHTYTSLFETETKRNKSKKNPKKLALAFEKPKLVFPVVENENKENDDEESEIKLINLMNGWEIFEF
ncbi:hypothetical protein Glove_346g70 [Diversispora epigaea]|uniref:CCAAT-binding factor domain-containing protein n=1 Tax=Diversispora epigaea TaxID=1348612 RepID=A0A397HJB3_9GLOM|nr:hypothetical protein Glove_346g70 [Diversispora epigaea]